MSVLSTALYTLNSQEEVEQMVGMAAGMTAAYSAQPGFEKLVVAQDVLDPMTIVTISWWESEEAVTAWGKSQEYRSAKSESGGGGLRPKMEFGRWGSLK
jgi:heme-degrading monooxygenase HmoA